MRVGHAGLLTHSDTGVIACAALIIPLARQKPRGPLTAPARRRTGPPRRMRPGPGTAWSVVVEDPAERVAVGDGRAPGGAQPDVERLGRLPQPVALDRNDDGL